MKPEDLQKYMEFMGKRTELKRTVCPVVLEDDWYYQNMRIILKRYAVGVVVYFIVLVGTVHMAKNICSDFASYSAITWLVSIIGYVFIVYHAIIQSSLDTLAMQQCFGYDKISRTWKRICRSAGVCACVNFIFFFVLCILYYEGILFSRYTALFCSAVMFLNCVIVRTVYKKQKIVFRFRYGFIEGKTKLLVKLKTGEHDEYKGDFDVSMDGASLLIVRQDNFFETYNAEDIVRLIMQNDDKHKVVYEHVSSEWILQNN